MRQLAVREGIFCGVSSGGAVAGALRIARENPGAVVVAIVCDRGDRYLSTGVFGEEHFSQGGHLIIKQVGAVGVIDGAQPAFALLLKDIGGASRDWDIPSAVGISSLVSIITSALPPPSITSIFP